MDNKDNRTNQNGSDNGNQNRENAFHDNNNERQGRNINHSIDTNVNENVSERIKHSNRQLWQIMGVGLLLFALMIGYLSYFVAVESNDVIDNSYNKRISNRANSVVRGTIYSSDGQALAYTEEQNGEDVRVYPYGDIFAHPVGYSAMGTTELEKAYNYELLRSSVSLPERLYDQMMGEKVPGDNVRTTLDSGLQSFCYNLLAGKKGSIVVLEVKTGRVLAMVSLPGYNPNTIQADWSMLTNEENTDGNLMNRATQCLYPPGSTFKVLTLLEFIRENPDTYADYLYECTGAETTEGYSLICMHNAVHGVINATQALQVSCNGFFSHIAKSFDRTSWLNTVNQFCFNQSVSFDIGLAKSAFSVTEEDSEALVMMKSIGQENVRETPLMGAMIMAAIGNNGVMMKPYLVDCIENANGTVVTQYSSEEQSVVMTAEETTILKTYLQAVVDGGSASAAHSDIISIGGKTGSAQYTSNGEDTHGWFTGIAPVEDTEIAISIILETGATGGTDAAPLAKEIAEYYFQR
ncbi:MAG: peptidoglycan D,D-transpeptidase FtsI family protein [Lachnospiraceae bacterium]